MKTAIITGASRGIGRELARELSKTYQYIAVCCQKNSDALYSLSEELNNSGVTCRSFTGDVADYEFVSGMLSSVVADTGSIDALINNAGISSVGLFTDLTPADWNRIINVNLTSVFNTCHLAVPHMVRQKSGHIINISSVWGLCGASCEVAYSATKGGINSFTKALAKELAPSNISVNAVAFGAIDTDMNRNLGADERCALEDEIPYGRMATPEEAAKCISKILEMPPYFTGDVVKFDGSWI